MNKDWQDRFLTVAAQLRLSQQLRV